MIVWLASYPRSGNTLFRMTLSLQLGLSSHARGDRRVFDQMEGLTELVGHEELTGPLAPLRASAQRFLVKTHDRPEGDDPAVYLVRDGRDVLASYARYRLRFRDRGRGLAGWWRRRRGGTFESELEELIRGRDPYGSWSEHATAWTARTGPTAVVRYEDLVEDPGRVALDALARIGCDPPDASRAELPSFEELHRKWPDFFRRGRAAGGSEMPPALEDLFWSHHGTVMESLGYRREA